MESQYEVVFSGRGFLDGRGLSSMGAIEHSTSALVAAEAPLLSEAEESLTPRQRRNIRRAKRRRELQRARAVADLAAASTNVIDDAPTVCRCGCGGALPARGHRSGRQRLYLPSHNRTWFHRVARRKLRQQAAA